jgi:hypothetical protein
MKRCRNGRNKSLEHFLLPEGNEQHVPNPLGWIVLQFSCLYPGQYCLISSTLFLMKKVASDQDDRKGYLLQHKRS